MKSLRKTITTMMLLLAMLTVVLPAKECKAAMHASETTIGAPALSLGKEYTFDYDQDHNADISIDVAWKSVYCQVQIPSDGNYTYKFRSAGETDVDIRLCDAYYKDIAGSNYLAHESSVDTIKLTAGTYYIRFYTHGDTEAVHGVVSVSKQKAPAANREYDTKEKTYSDAVMNIMASADILDAPCIKIAKEYSFGSNDDSFNMNISENWKSMYYKILVPEDGIYLYEFKSAGQTDVDIRLCDENYKDIGGSNYLRLESSVDAISLKKGVYYIRFYTHGDGVCGSVRLRNTNIKFKSAKGLSKSLKFTWTKFSGASGYEIRYSKKANMLGSKTVDTKSTSTTKTIKKLSAKKTYYAQIRSYIKKDSYGNKVYGAWSKKIKVKTK
ncbi:MAG: hypothetical protein Q4D51_12900 [Eubacteriales bacterium]|nr:hypothetical protein [Eubacteriales bacterium]